MWAGEISPRFYILMFFGEVACFVSSSVELKKHFQKPTLLKKEDVLLQRITKYYKKSTTQYSTTYFQVRQGWMPKDRNRAQGM